LRAYKGVEVALAGVLGSFGYNMTMSFGAGAVVHPLRITDASLIHWPAIGMLLLFVAALLLVFPKMHLGRTAGATVMATYPVFVVLVFVL
jgi:cation:H+ antiporter